MKNVTDIFRKWIIVFLKTFNRGENGPVIMFCPNACKCRFLVASSSRSNVESNATTSRRKNERSTGAHVIMTMAIIELEFLWCVVRHYF